MASIRVRLTFPEDLVREPESVLARICDFFALDPAGGWIERAAARVRGVPPLRAPLLPEHERARLQEVCGPGMALLGRT